MGASEIRGTLLGSLLYGNPTYLGVDLRGAFDFRKHPTSPRPGTNLGIEIVPFLVLRG